MEAFFERSRNSPLSDEELTRLAILLYENNIDKFKHIGLVRFGSKINQLFPKQLMATIILLLQKIETPIYQRHKMIDMKGDPSKHFTIKNTLLNDIPNGVCSNEEKIKKFDKYYSQKYKELSPPSHLSMGSGPGDPRPELDRRVRSFLFATRMTEIECSFGVSIDKLNEYISVIHNQEVREKLIQKREEERMKKARNNERKRFENAAKRLEKEQLTGRILAQRLEARSRIQQPAPENTLLNFVSAPSRANTAPAYTGAQIQSNLESVFNPAAGGHNGGRRRKHTRKGKKHSRRTRRR